jgi:uncharacterized protein YjbJ (UPF0337 family)
MNQDTAQGNWTELKGKIKAKWGKLTDDDLKEAQGNMEIIAGKLQKSYGYAKEKAEEELKEFRASLGSDPTSKR